MITRSQSAPRLRRELPTCWTRTARLISHPSITTFLSNETGLPSLPSPLNEESSFLFAFYTGRTCLPRSSKPLLRLHQAAAGKLFRGSGPPTRDPTAPQTPERVQAASTDSPLAVAASTPPQQRIIIIHWPIADLAEAKLKKSLDQHIYPSEIRMARKLSRGGGGRPPSSFPLLFF